MKVGILLCLTPVPSLNLILAQRQLVKGWGCSSVGCEALSSWMLSHMRVITAAPQRLSCVNPNYWYCDCLPKKKHLFTGRLTRMIAVCSIHYNGGILFSANNACSTAVGLELTLSSMRGGSRSPMKPAVQLWTPSATGGKSIARQATPHSALSAKARCFV